MSTPTPAGSEPFNSPTPLSLLELRVLGVLVEKAKTTPDAYPMSVNSLVAGSNQKSNRDPILNVNDEAVEETLDRLQPKGLATKILGGRVIRWKHNLYDAWQVEKVELAVLGELLLRGAQTEGELRTRASRMEPIDDLDALRAVLRPLAERKLVVFLGPEGRRGTLITHGFYTPQELDALRSQPSRVEEPAAVGTITRPGGSEQLNALEEEVASLRTQVQQLQEALAQMRQQLQTLKDALGA